MIETHHCERIRLPSVNDIFPNSSYDYNQRRATSVVPGPNYILVKNPPYHHAVSPLQHGHIVPYNSQLMQPIPVTEYPVNTMEKGPFQPSDHDRFSWPDSHAPQEYKGTAFRVHKRSNARQSNAWTSEDDDLLRYLKEVRNLGWREISIHFKKRTANGCQFRWRRITLMSKGSSREHHNIVSRAPEAASVKSNAVSSLLN